MAQNLALALFAIGALSAPAPIHQNIVKKTVAGGANLASTVLGLATGGRFESNVPFIVSNFTIGATEDVELILSTGWGDFFVNQGHYEPSPEASNTSTHFANFDWMQGFLVKDTAGPKGTDLMVKGQEFGAINVTPGVGDLGGVLGLSNPNFSFVGNTGGGWFQNLCAAKAVPECRFGLGLPIDDQVGRATWGSVDIDAFDGDLTIVPIAKSGWTVQGAVNINGKEIAKDIPFGIDSLYWEISGRWEEVLAIFNEAGVTPNVTTVNPGIPGHPESTYDILSGLYPCDQPPTLALALGGKTFDIAAQAFESENLNNGTCVSILHGYHQSYTDWHVGRAFYEGRYIDHNIDGKSMGFADLKA